MLFLNSLGFYVRLSITLWPSSNGTRDRTRVTRVPYEPPGKVLKIETMTQLNF